MSRESKTISFQVKDLGTRTDDAGQEFGQIEAYGAIFNNVDEGKDRILPGAFKRTIKNSKDRAAARDKKYLAPMLWQHDTHEVIGGWYDITEDSVGLRAKGDISLATQRGREYYALAKAGMTDEFSIIYDVPQGGAKYDKGGVRDLSEMRLFSIDPVTFAMNDATYTVDVKAASADDTAAQEARSKKYHIGIKDGGNVTKPSAQSDVPDAQWGDPVNYRYPMKDKAHADNAAARFGAASAREDYTSAEQDIIAKRILARQEDFGEEPDWWPLSSGKARGRHGMQKKTFAEHYQQQQCADLLRDWQDVVLAAFTSAVYDAFQIGDEPASDVSDALDALKDAVNEWVAEGVQYGLSDYLDAQGYDGGTESRMQNGTSYGYGYFGMARSTPMHQKADQAGKAMTESDATTGGFTADHVSKLKGAATKASKVVEKHADALHDAATEVKSLLGQASKAAKSGRAFSAANAQALSDHADALDDAADTLTKSMKRQMGTVNSVADDLATVLQGSEAAYGTDPGTPEDDEQEGQNGKHLRAPSLKTRAASTPPSQRSDTVAEDEIATALAQLRSLHTA